MVLCVLADLLVSWPFQGVGGDMKLLGTFELMWVLLLHVRVCKVYIVICDGSQLKIFISVANFSRCAVTL